MSGLTRPSGRGTNVGFAHPPSKTVTRLTFDPWGTLVLASSWDGAAYIFSRTAFGDTVVRSGVYKSNTVEDEALLDASFSADGLSFFTAGCTGAVWKYDVSRPDAAMMIGEHSMPVKACRFHEATNTVITAGWDRKLHMWDDRSPSPANTVELPERAYAMDVKDHRLVVATANKQVSIWDVSGPQLVFVAARETPLRQPLRCISMFTDNAGFVVGSAEGRCAVQYFDDVSRNFAFKCHRDTSQRQCNINAVNVIAFSRWNTFATGGSDGVFNFWCHNRRQRLKNFPSVASPLTACAFSSTNDAFVFAIGNDWSRGSDSGVHNTQIFWHHTQESEIRKHNG